MKYKGGGVDSKAAVRVKQRTARDPGYYSCDCYLIKDAEGTVPCCRARHISAGRICLGKVVRARVPCSGRWVYTDERFASAE